MVRERESEIWVKEERLKFFSSLFPALMMNEYFHCNWTDAPRGSSERSRKALSGECNYEPATSGERGRVSVDVHFILIKNSDSRVQQRRGLCGTSKLSPLADCKQLVGCNSLLSFSTNAKVNLVFDRKLHFSTLFCALSYPGRAFPSDFNRITNYRKLSSNASRRIAATEVNTAHWASKSFKAKSFFHLAFSLHPLSVAIASTKWICN